MADGQPRYSIHHELLLRAHVEPNDAIDASINPTNAAFRSANS